MSGEGLLAAVSSVVPTHVNVLTAQWSANNVSWSDPDFTVWVKTYRGDTAHHRCLTDLVCSNFSPVPHPTPRHCTPLPYSVSNECVWVGVWDYLPNLPVDPVEFTPELFRLAYATADRIHATAAPSHLGVVSIAGTSTMRVKTRSRQASQSGSVTPQTEKLWVQVSSLAADADCYANRMLNPNKLPYVWCHGDLHPANMFAPGGDASPEVLGCWDWESSFLAPQQWDIATILYGMVCAGVDEETLRESIACLDSNDSQHIVSSLALKATYHLSYILLRDASFITSERLATVRSIMGDASLIESCARLASLPPTSGL